jgi:hypothetical protein
LQRQRLRQLLKLPQRRLQRLLQRLNKPFTPYGDAVMLKIKTDKILSVFNFSINLLS